MSPFGIQNLLKPLPRSGAPQILWKMCFQLKKYMLCYYPDQCTIWTLVSVMNQSPKKREIAMPLVASSKSTSNSPIQVRGRLSMQGSMTYTWLNFMRRFLPRAVEEKKKVSTSSASPAREGSHWGGKGGDTKETQCRLSCSGSDHSESWLTCTWANIYSIKNQIFENMYLSRCEKIWGRLLLRFNSCDNVSRLLSTLGSLRPYGPLIPRGDSVLWPLRPQDSSSTSGKPLSELINNLQSLVRFNWHLHQGMKRPPWSASQKMLLERRYVGALLILVRGCQAKVHL